MDNLIQRVAKDMEEGIEKKLDAKYATKFVERIDIEYILLLSKYASIRIIQDWAIQRMQRLTKLSASTPHRQTVQEFLS